MIDWFGRQRKIVTIQLKVLTDYVLMFLQTRLTYGGKVTGRVYGV
jgi:hypothetical protein